MKKEIVLNNKKIKFIIKNNIRTRSVRLTIRSSVLTVSKPKLYPMFLVEKFLKEKSDWILKQLNSIPSKNSHIGTQRDYIKNKFKIRIILRKKIEYFNTYYNYEIGRISVKNQKTLWGSCSAKNNLNFNYKLIHLRDELIDYVVVHEICHLKEMNHGKSFWLLVEEKIPDYKNLRKELKNVNF